MRLIDYPLSQLALRARTLEASKIREVAELGMKDPEAIALWFGEGAWPTDPLIVSAAIDALQSSDHFYQPNNGKASLRQAIAAYSSELYDQAVDVERISVTASGMQGLSLAAQLLVTPGDQVVTVVPGWPNILETFRAAGAEVSTVALQQVDHRWHLDLDRLIDQLKPGVRAVVINSPNNPTGWTMSSADQYHLLEHCRKQGIWIVADEVYARLYLHGNVAPSFVTLANSQDLVLSVNSFSKCWSMTGWRLGWITAPQTLQATLGQLTEFTNSCSPGFIQQAAEVALQKGEVIIETLKARLEVAYAITEQNLRRFSRIDFVRPDGAFYCFFRVEGATDSIGLAKQILAETRVGMAPGIAFGDKGEGHLRLCFAQPKEVLETAFERLAPYLG